MPVSEWKEA